MRSVPTGFLDLQKSPSNILAYEIFFKRRFWDGEKYIFENDWTKISEKEILDIGSFTEQLQVSVSSEFKTSSVTLKFLNDAAQWEKEKGYFAADEISENGYQPFYTKFKIKLGFSNPENEKKLVEIFTGVAIDYAYDDEKKSCAITIASLQTFLENTEAKNICGKIILENVGVGDNIKTEFFTSRNSVSEILKVTVDDVEKVKNLDYELAGLNSFDEPCKITFISPVEKNSVVKVSYNSWFRNLPIENYISEILDLAKISDKNISPITLGTIENNITINSKQEFSEGENSYIDLNSTVGKIKVDYDSLITWNAFSAGNVASNGWDDLAPGNAYVWEILNGQLHGDNAGQNGTLRRFFGRDISFGSWEFDITFTLNAGHFKIWFMANSDTIESHDGYFLQNGRVGTALDILRFGYKNGSQENVLFTMSVGSLFANKTRIKIFRNENNIFQFFIDGVLQFTVEDSSFSKGDRFVIHSTDEIFIDNLRIPSETITAEHTSKIIDTHDGLSALGKLKLTHTLNPTDTLILQTRTSTDGVSWEDWADVDIDGGIMSAVKRYLQVKITILSYTKILEVKNNPYFPKFGGVRDYSRRDVKTEISEYNISFFSDKIFVSEGKFVNKNCHQALQDLMKICAYDYGFENETFFTRSKNQTNDINFEINQKNFLSSIGLRKSNFKNSYGGVLVTFKDFKTEIFNPTDDKDSAAAIGTIDKILQISLSDYINRNTDLTRAIAQLMAQRVRYPRQTYTIKTKILPQLQLADTLKLTLHHYGQNPIVDKICTITKATHDIFSATSTFELEEIIL